MKVNIENCVRHSNANLITKHTLIEMIENLKELRDRTIKNDLSALDEFFALYVFDDKAEYKRDKPGMR